MDSESIYINLPKRKPLPKPSEPKAEIPPVYKNLRILYAILIFLVLLVVAFVTAITILRSWKNACLSVSGKAEPNSTTENSTLAVTMVKSPLEILNASYQELHYKYWTIVKLSSEGWRMNDENFYYFSSEKKSWAEAQQFCVSKDSNLTSVTSEKEQAFLFRTIKTSHWIGLTDKGSEGIWHWVDGSPYDESKSARFWMPNQPDNWHQEQGLTEDCIHMVPGDLRSWNDLNCNSKENWICKISL
ncbi:C-type lectin domain family 4 member F-like isoform X2 [Macrotis lagotis]|uniref:C-type lectin domain family 4 member F-like isoform X2 n=1 Tax=Macrotis lagotis TaxID=92651 RepID=UPI003D69C133